MGSLATEESMCKDMKVGTTLENSLRRQGNIWIGVEAGGNIDTVSRRIWCSK